MGPENLLNHILTIFDFIAPFCRGARILSSYPANLVQEQLPPSSGLMFYFKYLGSFAFRFVHICHRVQVESLVFSIFDHLPKDFFDN